MPLEPARLAIVDHLRTIAGVASVEDEAPPQIGEQVFMVVYPAPGRAEPYQHAHSNADPSPVWMNHDVLVIEYHWRVPADEFGRYIPEVTRMLDAVRVGLLQGFFYSRFSNTVHALTLIDSGHYGEMGWGNDFTFGFRLLANIDHADIIDVTQ